MRLSSDHKPYVSKGANLSGAEETVEKQFWDRPPAYSVPPAWSEPAPPPRPKPSVVRSVGSKLLFGILFSGAIALLGYEVAHYFGVTWADVLAFKGKLGL